MGGCWALARRKFDEAMKSLPKGKAKNSAAYQGLNYCYQLFTIEQELAEKHADIRFEERQKQAKPVLAVMLAWVNSKTAAPNSALGKALHYLKEQWPYLTNYLRDGRLEVSNNRTERSIKPFVIDRKNFLFANTQSGAQGRAVIFSLIQTVIENNLDPWRYLTWLIQTASQTSAKKLDVTTLLPWNAPAECRSARKYSTQQHRAALGESRSCSFCAFDHIRHDWKSLSCQGNLFPIMLERGGDLYEKMVKLNHLVFRQLVTTHGLTQECVAEEMDNSVCRARNFCKRDTDPAVCGCAAASELFNMPIDARLISRPAEE